MSRKMTISYSATELVRESPQKHMEIHVITIKENTDYDVCILCLGFY